MIGSGLFSGARPGPKSNIILYYTRVFYLRVSIVCMMGGNSIFEIFHRKNRHINYEFKLKNLTRFFDLKNKSKESKIR